MKYIVLLGDGMADLPIAALGGKTCLEAADMPVANALAWQGEVGLCQTVPKGFAPGSDVANMSVLGYNVPDYYTGRSPIEAVSMGIKLGKDDLAVRCNMVTIENGVMKDYSGSGITTSNAEKVIAKLNEYFKEHSDKFPNVEFYLGVSYRHCLVLRSAAKNGKTLLTPPHDITNKPIAGYLPKGGNAGLMLSITEAAKEATGQDIWLWGEGTALTLPSFEKRWGLKGGVISAVDLVRGLGIAAGMEIIKVDGITGELDTNYAGKAAAAVNALKGGLDYVYLHVEAPDECGHRGDVKNKIAAMELIDKRVLAYITDGLADTDYRLLFMPDHPTPCALMTHTNAAVPFLIFDNTNRQNSGIINKYSEANGKASGIYYESGERLIAHFLGKE